jgi:hypothetical protein
MMRKAEIYTKIERVTPGGVKITEFKFPVRGTDPGILQEFAYDLTMVPYSEIPSDVARQLTRRLREEGLRVELVEVSRGSQQKRSFIVYNADEASRFLTMMDPFSICPFPGEVERRSFEFNKSQRVYAREHP